MEETNKDLLITDQTQDTQTIQKNQLTWCQRTFKPMEKGSQRGAIFLGVMTAFGTGVFTLHHLFIYCGLIWGTLLMCFMAFAFIYNAYMIIYLSEKYPECNSYSVLIEKCLGKFSRQFFDFSTAFSLFIGGIGGLLSFSKLFYVNFDQLIWSIFSFVPAKQQTLEFFCTRFVWLVGVFVFLIVVQRDLNSLRYVSLFSLCMYMITFLVLCIQLPSYINQQKQNNDYVQNWTDFDFSGSLVCFGLILTSSNIVSQFFGIKTTMSNPVIYRQKKVYFRGYILVHVFYYFIALVSYWSLGQNSNLDLFVMRDPIKGSSDILMKIIRSCLLIGIILCAGLNIYPIKAIVDSNHLTNSRERNLLISLVLTLIPVIAASLFNNVTNYMTLGGSFGVLMMNFVFPGIIVIRENIYKGNQKNLLIAFSILITILGISATIVNIINFK